MPSKELSREELFALIWEKPTQEVTKELGVSDKELLGKVGFKNQDSLVMHDHDEE